jgi:plastocyanin
MKRFARIALFVLAANGGSLHAASLSLYVKSADGTPIENAVVYLVSAKTSGMVLRTPDVKIDQIDKRFDPLVSVVQTGTRIQFPNRDNIRHHVYSFSPPKKFEIKLYADTPGKPILFDKPGYVAMGCNIHDGMIAHLLIVDTPYFAKTDRQGQVKIGDIAAGEYTLGIWHYPSPDKEAFTQSISINADTSRTLVIKARPAD